MNAYDLYVLLQQNQLVSHLDEAEVIFVIQSYFDSHGESA